MAKHALANEAVVATGERSRLCLLAEVPLFEVHKLTTRLSPWRRLGHWTDGWDGYPAARQRILDAMKATKLANPVFIGGDIHSFWTTDLKADFNNPSSLTVATECVGTSITSDPPNYELIAQLLPENPHVRYFESRRRGCVSVDLSRERMMTKMQVISDRRDPKATVATLKTFVVEAGKPGAVAA